jgi:hypothetical protein
LAGARRGENASDAAVGGAGLERLLGEEHPVTLIGKDNLAATLGALGERCSQKDVDSNAEAMLQVMSPDLSCRARTKGM